jgi:hypothetical protein
MSLIDTSIYQDLIQNLFDAFYLRLSEGLNSQSSHIGPWIISFAYHVSPGFGANVLDTTLARFFLSISNSCDYEGDRFVVLSLLFVWLL